MAGIDSFTKLLLHFDGADASVFFGDSATGKALTTYGNAQIDTAQSKFGGASGLFDGTGDLIDFPDTPDVDMAAGDFTVDFWIRTAQTTDGMLCGQSSNAGSDIAFYFRINSTANKMTFYIYDTAGRSVVSATSINNGNWHHIAGVRYSNEMKLYINGVSEGTPVGSLGTIPDRTTRFAIGRMGEYDGVYFNGWIDEFRISKGIARWTANFTPPTKAYSRDSDFFLFM